MVQGSINPATDDTLDRTKFRAREAEDPRAQGRWPCHRAHAIPLEAHLPGGIPPGVDWHRNQHALQARCSVCAFAIGYWPVLSAAHGHYSERVHPDVVNRILDEIQQRGIPPTIKLVKAKIQEVAAAQKFENTLRAPPTAPRRAEANVGPKAPGHYAAPQPQAQRAPTPTQPSSSRSGGSQPWVYVSNETTSQHAYGNEPGQSSHSPGPQRPHPVVPKPGSRTMDPNVIAVCEHCQQELPREALMVEAIRCELCKRFTEVRPRLRPAQPPGAAPAMVETPTPAAAQQLDAQIISEAASRLIEGNYVDEGIRREHLRELQAALTVATERSIAHATSGNMLTDEVPTVPAGVKAFHMASPTPPPKSPIRPRASSVPAASQAVPEDPDSPDLA